MTLGEHIREQRTKNNMTQEYLAEQLNVSRQAVSKWENGTAAPSMENLLELARLFQISLSQLSGTYEEPETISPPSPSRRPERFWQLLFAIAAVTALLLAALCIALLWNSMRDRTAASEGIVELAYSTAENQMLAEAVASLPNGQEVRLRLVMTEGEYFTDEWENYVPGGGVYETNYMGSYQLQATDEQGQVLFAYELTPDFDREALNFPEAFDLEICDYNQDGYPDFTIGQYGSSSISLYNLYTLEAGGIRRSCPEMIPDSGMEFSKIFPVDASEEGTGFHTQPWNNAAGQAETVRYRWDSVQELFLPVE